MGLLPWGGIWMGESGLAGLCTGPVCISHQALLGAPAPRDYTPFSHSRPGHRVKASSSPGLSRFLQRPGGPQVLAIEGAWSLGWTRLTSSPEDKP